MNVNFGLFPPIEGKTKKADRKRLYTGRAEEALKGWIANSPLPFMGGAGGGAVPVAPDSEQPQALVPTP